MIRLMIFDFWPKLNNTKSQVYLFFFTKHLLKKSEKQVDTLKSLKPPKKIDELKQSESVFSKIQSNDLIIDKLKEIRQFQNNIKLGNLKY